MGKRAKQVLGFSQDAKQRAMRDMGFSLLEYTGKIAEAPQQIRHLARDLQPGMYLINLQERTVVKQLDINASNHKFVYDQSSLLNEQFKETIFYVMQREYVYALKNEDGTFAFTGQLADDKVIKAEVITELVQNKYGKGYYGVQIDRQSVRFVTHSYHDFEVLLFDIALYSPVSPFVPYASQIVTHRYTDLPLQYTKFGFSGDAVITLGDRSNGKMVATVVNYPEIDGVEKMFVKAPEMLRVLLTLTNPSVTADDILKIKADAQRIIGEIGT